MMADYSAQRPLQIKWDVSTLFKKRESAIFRMGRFNPQEMLGLLVTEALLCGSPDICVEHLETGWWVITSAMDWITEADKVIPFVRPVTYKQGGPNSLRAEVYLTVFAREVLTASEEGYFMLKGESAPALGEILRGNQTIGRLVAFRE